ncbi:MAG: alpha/beta fold hydrolase [Chloroflexi bacterium]|nr:alpha/beta fold hydrolase [Chloroflexota bacterium]
MLPRLFTRRFPGPPIAAALLALAVVALVACSEDAPTAQCADGDVEFASSDGLPLCGRHYGSGDVTVVLAHMRPSDQESWRPFAETLADEGYAVFTFNFRGYEPSSGDKELGLIDLDLGGALDYLAIGGVERPVLVGASMGGTAAVKVAANRDVAGVVALSAPAAIDGLSAADYIASVDEPKFFMVAEDDVSARMDSAALYDASSGERFYEVFTGGEHGTDLVYGRHSELVQGRILELLELFTQ